MTVVDETPAQTPLTSEVVESVKDTPAATPQANQVRKCLFGVR